MRWVIETLNAAVDAEIESLPMSLRARFLRLLETVQTVGLENMREPHVKHFDGKLWGLRAKAAEGMARGLYVTATGRRVIVRTCSSRSHKRLRGRPWLSHASE